MTDQPIETERLTFEVLRDYLRLICQPNIYANPHSHNVLLGLELKYGKSEVHAALDLYFAEFGENGEKDEKLFGDDRITRPQWLRWSVNLPYADKRVVVLSQAALSGTRAGICLVGTAKTNGVGLIDLALDATGEVLESPNLRNTIWTYLPENA